ncbi:MAG TPA: alpha/beta hydrolase [Ktedonobacteraceae bacterium]|nr:alpha/beta hydrolase [Ktedonobacteraceae bacterium]
MFSSLFRLRVMSLVLVVVLIPALLFTGFLVRASQANHQHTTTAYRLQTVTYCSPDNIPQLMDIYTPLYIPGNRPMPVVEMVHGGGWTGGSKATIDTLEPIPEIATVMHGLLARGFIVTAVNYRLAPQYKFPANIEDVKCSIRYLRAHSAQYHLDPNRIGLMGSSAGGHLVSLAGLADPRAGWDVGEYTDKSSAVQAVIDMFGPEYIASGIGDHAIGSPAIFGSDPDELHLASPPHYIARAPATDPPFLILQGDHDRTVPPYHTLRFYNELLDAGQPAILQMVQNAGHEFEPYPTGTAIIPSPDQLSGMMVQFFVKYLMSGTPIT